MNKVENANFTTYFLFFTIPLLFSTMAVAKMDSLWKPSGEPSDIMFWEDSFKWSKWSEYKNFQFFKVWLEHMIFIY